MIRPILFALSLAVPAAAEPGLTAVPFLQRALGARASGMGSAFVAVQDSIDSMQYNPGALGTLRAPSLTSTYLNGFGSTTYGFLGYAHPSRYGTFATGALYYNAGSIDLNLSNGTTGRVTAEEDTAWTLSYALALTRRLSLGATYRFLRLSLAETAHATSSQSDLGVLWSPPIKYLSLGAAYQYLGPDIRFENVGDPSPKTLRYGLALRFPDINAKRIDPSVDLDAFDTTVAADMVQTLHEKKSPRMGAEFGLRPALLTRVAIRTGWIFNRDSESFTFGAGLQHGDLSFDYAFGRARDLDNAQQLTLTYRFN